MWKPRFPQSEKPLGEAIADQIEQAILAGELRPGEKMPTHRGLARQLGVGVGTVTRAYSIARARGLLTGEVGRGTYVLGGAAPGRHLLAEEARVSLLSNKEFSEALRSALDSLARRPRFSDSLMVFEPQGALNLREAAARWIEWCGLPSRPDRILPLTGTRATIGVVLDALLAPGEVALTEELGWAASLSSRVRDRLVPIAIDGEGLIPEALEEACRKHHATVLLCNPTLHIPTSAVMSDGRRRKIADVCDRHGLCIVEDDPGIPLLQSLVTPLSSYLQDRSVYVADPSPLLHPGVRGCYLHAPSPYLEKIHQAMLTALGRTHHLEHEIMRLWFENGTAERLLRLRERDHRKRQEIASLALDGCRYQTHPLDSELWLDAPDDRQFVDEMRKHGAQLESGREYELRDGAGKGKVCYHLGIATLDKLPQQLAAARRLLLE